LKKKLFIKEKSNMGTNFYIVYGDEEKMEVEPSRYHIGKSSAGWVFQFDLQFLQRWQKLGDPRWDIVKPYWERITTSLEHCDKPTMPEAITGLTYQDIKELLNTKDSYILDEYNNVVTSTQFLDVVAAREQNPLTTFSYQQNEGRGADNGMYIRNFSIGSMLFTPYTNFT